MMYVIQEFKEQVKKELKKATGKDIADTDLSNPPDSKLGDLSSTIAFQLAKELKKNPKQLADDIVKKIKPMGFIKEVKTIGPYINFFLDKEKFTQNVLDESTKKDYGSLNVEKDKCVFVESPAINPNKPLHIGHGRNSVLGNVVANILEYAGYNAVRLDYIDDLGLQVGQSVWGSLNFKDKPSGKFDHFLGYQYVEVAKKMIDPKVDAEVREIMKKMEEGNNEIAKKAKELVMDCVRAQYQTHERMKIYHDVMVCESDIVKSGLLEKSFELLKKAAGDNIIIEKEGKNKGCLVLKLSHLPEFAEMTEGDKILARSDGTLTYTGKDIGFHLWKFGIIKDVFSFKKLWKQPNGKCVYSTDVYGKEKLDYKADKIINVIDFRQIYPQMVVKTAMLMLGKNKEHDNYFHLAYNFVTLPEGEFSGRKGTWIGYTVDDALNKAVADVKQIVNKNNPELSEEKLNEIAEQVGIGAVKFALVSLDWNKPLVFDWKKVLDFEGDTGPYLQYAHARTAGILQKAGKVKIVNKFDFANEHEQALVKKISEFPVTIQLVADTLKPHNLTEYLLELTHVFSGFYNSCPVLKAESEELKNARLQLVAATKNVLKIGLNLLGIEAPERM